MAGNGITLEMAKFLAQADPDGSRGLRTPEVERVLTQSEVDEAIRAQAETFISLATFTPSPYTPYVGAQLSTRVEVEGRTYAVTVSIKDIEESQARAQAVKEGRLTLQERPSKK